MSTGYGTGGFGTGTFGATPDVNIIGVVANISAQSWSAGVDTGRPVAYLTGAAHTITAGTAADVAGLQGSVRDLFYVGGLTTSPTVDPLMTSKINGALPTETSTSWVRGWIEAFSPAGFWTGNSTVDNYVANGAAQLWPAASRGVLGVYFNSTAVNEIHYIDDAQFEHNGLSNWDMPRDTKINVIPDRVNATVKQTYTSGATTPMTATGATLTVTAAGLSVAWTANPGYVTYPVTVPSDVNKGWVTVSMYVANPTVAVEILPVATVAYTQGYVLNADLSYRIWCSYQIPTSGVADFKFQPVLGGFLGQNVSGAPNPYASTGTYVGLTSVVNQFQAEAAPNMGSYFDNTYVYTNDVLVGGSGKVSLFEDKKVKNYRLTQILNQTMPIGATFTLTYNTY